MSKIKYSCPDCGQLLQCDEEDRGKKIRCPHCKFILRIPKLSPRAERPKRRRKKKFHLPALALIVVAGLVALGSQITFPTKSWPDRRPIGVLFLASNFHSSATNPRGWFNDPDLNFTGPDGVVRFRQALLDYADRSIAILKRIDAQGVIVWDLEGEQFPHKTTYIGDPRLVDRLAPEMAPVVDEFFARLKHAGFRVGVTIRPQQLVFDNIGGPRQQGMINTKRVLLEKIDYARARWDATLFYVDSNGGIRRPDEAWQLRSAAAERPGVLLIPEHRGLFYQTFSAPYVNLSHNATGTAPGFIQKLFPQSFRALDISDASSDAAGIIAASQRGDILLCRAWMWSPDCELLETLAHQRAKN